MIKNIKSIKNTTPKELFVLMYDDIKRMILYYKNKQFVTKFTLEELINMSYEWFLYSYGKYDETKNSIGFNYYLSRTFSLKMMNLNKNHFLGKTVEFNYENTLKKGFTKTQYLLAKKGCISTALNISKKEDCTSTIESNLTSKLKSPFEETYKSEIKNRFNKYIDSIEDKRAKDIVHNVLYRKYTYIEASASHKLTKQRAEQIVKIHKKNLRYIMSDYREFLRS